MGVGAFAVLFVLSWTQPCHQLLPMEFQAYDYDPNETYCSSRPTRASGKTLLARFHKHLHLLICANAAVLSFSCKLYER